VRILGTIIGVVIISCSATFVSIVLETNAPANWGRSIEVHCVKELADSDSFKLEAVCQIHDGRRRKFVHGIDRVSWGWGHRHVGSSVIRGQVEI